MSIEAGVAASLAAQIQPQTSDINKAQQQVQAQQKVAAQQADPAEMGARIERSIDTLNDLMAKGQRSLNFSVDNSSDQVVVRVVDTNTDEVIRQIPNEESIRLAEYIDGLVGVIFNKNA